MSRKRNARPDEPNIVGEIDRWTVIHLDADGKFWAVLRDHTETIRLERTIAMAWTEEALRLAYAVQMKDPSKWEPNRDR